MKKFTGLVVRTNNAKTAHVDVKSDWMHPKYLKKKTMSRVFAAHDELGVHVGDEVEIVECRQMSASKFFRVGAVVKKSAALVEVAGTVSKPKKKTAKKATAKKATA